MDVKEFNIEDFSNKDKSPYLKITQDSKDTELSATFGLKRKSIDDLN